MKTVDVVIPTRNRRLKLMNTLSTIPLRGGIKCVIVCDDDPDTYHRIIKNPLFNITVHLTNAHCGSVHSRNMVIPDLKDGVLYATDDIEFSKGTIESAVKLFNACFPDDDGVVGIAQKQAHHPTGIALVGKKFIDRYPERLLFFPGYYHFAAQEIHWLAEKLGKFEMLVNPNGGHWIYHAHPCFYPEEMDQTHKDAREHSAIDHEFMKARQERGLIWGDKK